jgi:hypothetical protein
MPQVSNHKFVIKGVVLGREGRAFFVVDNVELFLLPGAVKALAPYNIESVEATISGEVSFEGKNKKDGTRAIVLKSSEDIIPKNMSLDVPTLSLCIDNVNLLPPQGASFQTILSKILHEDLNSSQYDEMFKRAYIPWTLEEEEIALLTYLKNRGQEYSKIMALAKQVSAKNKLNHTFDALEMRINSYRYLDRNSGVEGLHDRSEQTELLWQDFVEGRYIPNFAKLDLFLAE